MAASLKIDQVGLELAPGVAGRSRADGLSNGAEVTLTSSAPGTPTVYEFLWVPDGDTTAVASLTNLGDTATFTPTADISGTYRIRLTVGAGRTKTTQILTFSIRTPNRGLRKPALGERASEKASLLYNDASAVAKSETNAAELTGPFSAGNYGGWYESMMELYDAVDEGAVASGGSGGGSPELFASAIQDTGNANKAFFFDEGYGDIAWSPELGRVVQVGRFASSYDGVSWSPLPPFQGPGFSDDHWTQVVWCGDSYQHFVAIAFYDGSDYENVIISVDGLDWNTTTFEDDAAGMWSTLVYAPAPYNGGNGLLVALSTEIGGTNPDGFDSKTSADGGLTWTGLVHGLGVGGWRSIAFSPELGRFVACGLSGAVAWSDNPAVSWTLAATPPSPSSNHYSVAWSGELGLFVVTADNIGQTYSVATSPDGDVWTTVSITDPTDRDWRCVVWTGNAFVVAAQKSTECLVSSDGLAWFLRPAAPVDLLYQMIYIPERDRIVGVSSTPITLISDRYIAKSADIEGILKHGTFSPTGVIWSYTGKPGEALSLFFTASCARNGFPGKAHFVVSAFVTIRDGGTVDVQDIMFLNGPFRDDEFFDVDVVAYGPSQIVITVAAQGIWRVHGKLTVSDVLGGGDPEA